LFIFFPTKRYYVFILNVPDRTYVKQNFNPSATHRVDADLEVKRTRKLGEDIIFSREIVTSDTQGCLRDYTYHTRLYSPDQIAALLYANQFDSISFQKDFMCRQGEADYGTMTNRMIVITKKSDILQR